MNKKFNGSLPGLLINTLLAIELFISIDYVFAADEAYVMGYFTESPDQSEAGYILQLAYSYNGLYYIPLNKNNPVGTSTLGEQGLCNPFILSKQYGNFVILTAKTNRSVIITKCIRK